MQKLREDQYAFFVIAVNLFLVVVFLGWKSKSEYF